MTTLYKELPDNVSAYVVSWERGNAGRDTFQTWLCVLAHNQYEALINAFRTYTLNHSDIAGGTVTVKLADEELASMFYSVLSDTPKYIIPRYASANKVLDIITLNWYAVWLHGDSLDATVGLKFRRRDFDDPDWLAVWTEEKGWTWRDYVPATRTRIHDVVEAHLSNNWKKLPQE